MRKIIVLLLSVLALTGCLKPKPEELEFFVVTMENPVAVSGVLGQVSLEGSINGLNIAKVEEYGFLYANDPDDLLVDSPNVHKVAFPGPEGNKYFSKRLTIGLGTKFYFKAFAKLEKRVVYSDLPKPFDFGDLVFLIDSADVKNNEVSVQGALIGLQAFGVKVTGHGHIFCKTNGSTTFGNPDCRFTNFGETNTDYLFTSHLENLDFNSFYVYRTYAFIGSDTVYSKAIYLFAVHGGWKKANDLPTFYQEGTAATLTSQGQALAFLGFGTNKVAPVVISDYPRNFWQFDPTVDNGIGNWTEKEPFAMPSDLPRTNAGSFVIKDTIYILYGEYFDNGEFNIVRELHKYAANSNTWTREPLPTPMMRRTGVVAFSLKEKGYVGTGRYRYKDNNDMWVDTELNDFWEYDPGTGWRQVASMPLQIQGNPVNYVAGRREAAAFTIGNSAFVGGGVTFNILLRDFWQFTPPDSPQDSGHWDQVSSFPGTARIQAVSFALSGKGYYGIGTGLDVVNYDDFWEFDPNGSWKEINPFPGGKRKQAIAFSLLEKGYVGTGIKRVVQSDDTITEEVCNDLWMYIPDEL